MLCSGIARLPVVRQSSPSIQYPHPQDCQIRRYVHQRLHCQALFAQIFAPKASRSSGAVRDLLARLQDTQRGLSTSPEQKEAILRLAQELEQAQAGQSKLQGGVNATWKLLWTTEKETLFILKNASLFNTQAGDVYQVIDGANKQLQNVITFPPNGSFIVDSSLEPEGDARHNFKFSGAKFTVNGRAFRLPPFGKGWFDTVYMDKTIRIAKDIRGDTLITEKAGPPMTFT